MCGIAPRMQADHAISFLLSQLAGEQFYIRIMKKANMQTRFLFCSCIADDDDDGI